MEAVSMKADMRLQARSLACKPVSEHRTMVVMVGGDDDDDNEGNDEKWKKEKEGRE